MRPGLFISFLLAIVVATYTFEVRTYVAKVPGWQNYLPPPFLYTYVVIIWAVLGVVADMGGDALAAAFGFGLVLAMFYTAVNSGVPILTPKPDSAKFSATGGAVSGAINGGGGAISGAIN